MADPADVLREHLAAVVALGRRTPSGLGALSAAEDTDLVALLPAVQSLVQAGQGLAALVSGEIARRDGGRTGPSLAQRLGARSARGLVAAAAGMPFGQASAHVAASEIIRRGTGRTGAKGAPERPHVAEAVLAGDLSLSLALLIDDTLEALRDALTSPELDALEAALVERAVSGDCSVATFTKECRRLVEKADPAGADDRDEALKAKASIRETRLRNGLLRVVAELDPERAAYWLAAVRTKTNPRREPSQAEGSDPTAPRPGGAQPDPMVTRLDAFTSICKDSLRADEGDQAGVDTTVLVRIDLTDLLTGEGSATLDGIDTPISAASARRLAVNADLIPQVFGGASQLLDQGTSRRLFTKAQRYAIYAGYDGCAFPSCDLPLAMTEIHHLGRWATRHEHGRGTDLANGLPLCAFPPRRHGRHAADASRRNRLRGPNRLMERGWDAELDPDGTPWFTPPIHVDRQRRRRRGSRREQTLAA
ncbi:DUF222 domain-containing protein [Amnibacterium endophyticum]|uniref:DUF222 domain-containing protein n=1 Tax=Amnibacterium endophyticum TaxID=2109337 RepID=A0ABW4LCR2_9MICO